MILWRKSTHSQGGGQGECVEVSINIPRKTLLRDSKKPHGPRLILTQGEFTNLIHAIKAAEE